MPCPENWLDWRGTLVAAADVGPGGDTARQIAARRIMTSEEKGERTKMVADLPHTD